MTNGKRTIWRCISYWKQWFSSAMLNFGGVSAHWMIGTVQPPLQPKWEEGKCSSIGPLYQRTPQQVPRVSRYPGFFGVHSGTVRPLEISWIFMICHQLVNHSCIICHQLVNHTVDGWNPAPVNRYVYPSIYRVLYIPGGAGFLPSTVVASYFLTNQT